MELTNYLLLVGCSLLCSIHLAYSVKDPMRLTAPPPPSHHHHHLTSTVDSLVQSSPLPSFHLVSTSTSKPVVMENITTESTVTPTTSVSHRAAKHLNLYKLAKEVEYVAHKLVGHGHGRAYGWNHHHDDHSHGWHHHHPHGWNHDHHGWHHHHHYDHSHNHGHHHHHRAIKFYHDRRPHGRNVPYVPQYPTRRPDPRDPHHDYYDHHHHHHHRAISEYDAQGSCQYGPCQSVKHALDSFFHRDGFKG